MTCASNEAWLGSQETWITVFHGENVCVTWVKQCHKPPIWEWFIPPVYGEIGGGLLWFYPHYTWCVLCSYSKLHTVKLPTNLVSQRVFKFCPYPSVPSILPNPTFTVDEGLVIRIKMLGICVFLLMTHWFFIMDPASCQLQKCAVCPVFCQDPKPSLAG